MGNYYALLSKTQFGGYLAVTCLWNAELENHVALLSEFANKLQRTITFFAGIRQSTILEKRKVLEIIIDMAIKGRVTNLDALDADFIRRAIPPALRSLCIPHEPVTLTTKIIL